MKLIIKSFISFVTIAFLFVGCATKTYNISIHPKKNNTKKRIILFLDGTHNDLKSRTNISALFNIVDNQELDNLYLFYNEGVGTGTKILGMATGLGFGKDIREAYHFLCENYDSGSKVYLFGFSRGAFTARVLSSMLETVGLYNLKNLSENEKKEFINGLYTKVYKGKNKSKQEIRNNANEYLASWRNKTCHSPITSKIRSCGVSIEQLHSSNNKVEIPVEIIGIWDTVEALGTLPTTEAILDKGKIKKDKQKIVKPNPLYYENYCNVKHILHALALDDNRAYVFTPIIISSKKYFNGCDIENNVSKIVNEVWFSGAHTDVGGGGYPYTYKNLNKNLGLPGISLNWMLQEIKKIDSTIISKNIKVYEDNMGFIHNSEEGLPLFYRDYRRVEILKKYLDENQSNYKSIHIHHSVLNRIKNKEINFDDEYNSKWYLEEYFNDCFEKSNKNKIIFKGCNKIKEINNSK